ncbi:hypothetical protein [Oceanobacillus neutriphilus]|uniref:Uncharacterized protein n=1 Tax=Oceanobacillus neutriphilus TaxID=531815 RepID=A0ABQ2P254_9BACI|nr:hypothetical protein [Oceanobacillus neutriphilus]GGP16374.1 hypothetical protein GCM10011346_48150 [Oceanobacillus neutriphilus]
MTTLTEQDANLLTEQLSEALLRFSDSKISKQEALNIANVALRNVDLNDPVFAHKGLNWYAKEILKKVDI